MREVLRGSLRRSLRAISAEDRLAAAWPVVCGRTLAERGNVSAYNDGTLRVEVVDPVWLGQLSSMRRSLAAELGETSGVPVHRIEFTVRRRSAS
jgi:predicted nucleic acid-binding Zn ribbon protein